MIEDDGSDLPSGHDWIAHHTLGYCSKCDGHDEHAEVQAWRRHATKEREAILRAGQPLALGHANDDAPRFVIGVQALSRVFGLPPSTLRKWADHGLIPSSKAPGPRSRYLFDVEAVAAALAAFR